MHILNLGYLCLSSLSVSTMISGNHGKSYLKPRKLAHLHLEANRLLRFCMPNLSYEGMQGTTWPRLYCYKLLIKQTFYVELISLTRMVFLLVSSYVVTREDQSEPSKFASIAKMDISSSTTRVRCRRPSSEAIYLPSRILRSITFL
jgi:hypothetical protein